MMQYRMKIFEEYKRNNTRIFITEKSSNNYGFNLK